VGTLDREVAEKTSERRKTVLDGEKKGGSGCKAGKIVSKAGKNGVFRRISPGGGLGAVLEWQREHNRQDAKSQKVLSSRHDRSDEYTESFCRACLWGV
jgi:hypothetical protein